MKITREGKRFILAAVLIGVAAVNTGNNLIYLIFSLMLSFILIAIALLRTNLSGMSLEVLINHPVFAGERSRALFTIRNRKQRIPAYSIHITAPGVSSPVYCTFVPPKGYVEHEKDVTIAQLTADVQASTPTDAAKIITANYLQVLEKLEYLNNKIKIYLFHVQFIVITLTEH